MYIGVDIGGSHISAGLIDQDGKIIRKLSCSNNVKNKYEQFIKNTADLCQELLKEEGMDICQIDSLGIGIPGSADNENGTVTSISNIKMKDAPIRQQLKKNFDIPIYIENDANCAAFGEFLCGAAKGTRVSVTITIGTGIGVGIIINDKIFGGFNSAASEQGHNVIVVGGERCNCGRKGCWEAYSSANALIRETKKLLDMEGEFINSKIHEVVKGDYSKINGKIVFDAAREGDVLANEVVHQYVMYLSEGLANVINAIMPEVLVIAGGLSQQGDYLLNMLTNRVNNYIYTKRNPRTELRIAKLGVDAGIIGAGMLEMNY